MAHWLTLGRSFSQIWQLSALGNGECCCFSYLMGGRNAKLEDIKAATENDQSTPRVLSCLLKPRHLSRDLTCKSDILKNAVAPTPTAPQFTIKNEDR